MKASGQIEITAYSCIETVSCQLPAPPTTDWVFFYSPNSVRLFFEQYIYCGQKLGAIGMGTAEMIKSLGLEVSFSSAEPNPDLVVKEFVSVLKPDEKVLSAFGNLSHKRLSGILSSEQIVEFEHYSTHEIEYIPVSHASYLLFTSPSNALAYLSKHGMNASQVAIAIGQTTLQALEELGVQNKMAAQFPSEEGFWAAIQKDIKKK